MRPDSPPPDLRFSGCIHDRNDSLTPFPFLDALERAGQHETDSTPRNPTQAGELEPKGSKVALSATKAASWSYGGRWTLSWSGWSEAGRVPQTDS